MRLQVGVQAIDEVALEAIHRQLAALQLALQLRLWDNAGCTIPLLFPCLYLGELAKGSLGGRPLQVGLGGFAADAHDAPRFVEMGHTPRVSEHVSLWWIGLMVGGGISGACEESLSVFEWPTAWPVCRTCSAITRLHPAPVRRRTMGTLGMAGDATFHAWLMVLAITTAVLFTHWILLKTHVHVDGIDTELCLAIQMPRDPPNSCLRRSDASCRSCTTVR